MNRLVVLLFLLTSLNLKAQALYPGNIMFDTYGGFPNFGKMFITTNLDAYKTEYLKGIGPSGFRAEYLVDDNIGVGFDFMYNYVDFKYKMLDSSYFGDQIVTSNNEYHSIMKRLRIHFRFNYHFEHDDPRFDTYVGFGLGYNNRTYSSTKNGIDNTNEFKSRIQLIPFPVSARVCFGGRYYFSQYVGLVGEVGLGGPLVSLGLALKY